MLKFNTTFNAIGFVVLNCFILCMYSICVATQCNLQIPLLDYDDDEPYYDIVSDERISASSHLPHHPPSEARMSGDRWCAESMCTVGSERQYLAIQVYLVLK